MVAGAVNTLFEVLSILASLVMLRRRLAVSKQGVAEGSGQWLFAKPDGEVQSGEVVSGDGGQLFTVKDVVRAVTRFKVEDAVVTLLDRAVGCIEGIQPLGDLGLLVRFQVAVQRFLRGVDRQLFVDLAQVVKLQFETDCATEELGWVAICGEVEFRVVDFEKVLIEEARLPEHSITTVCVGGAIGPNGVSTGDTAE